MASRSEQWRIGRAVWALAFGGLLLRCLAGWGAEGHWAFRPVSDPRPPKVESANWVRTDVDRFVLARLEKMGARPGRPAGPRVLLRRLAFDLTGLPPSPDEVDAFAAEAAAGGRERAVESAIERYLASPRYGERWGRHWLDVARYSDTKGYVYGREERRFVHAPTYRDWVVRAFNDDLPYDRFLLLQIAADRLVPEGSPDLAAMGFITGGRRFIGVTHDIIDDRIDVVTRGAMGLTVQCARCHDHKYDPVPIADYYSLYGVFHGADDRLVPLVENGDAELAKRQGALAEAMARRREEAAVRLRSRVGEYLAAQLELSKYPEEGFDQILGAEDIIPASVRRWRDYLHTHRDPADPILGPWHGLRGLKEEGFAEAAGRVLEAWRARGAANPRVAQAFASPPSSMREAAERYGRLFAEAEAGGEGGGSDDGRSALRAFLRGPESPAAVPDTGIVGNEGFFPLNVTEELWKLQGEVDRRLMELGVPSALVLAERPPEPDPRVFVRGSPSRLGESVPRRFLSVLAGPDRPVFREGSGRLEMAKAVVAPENPLTARVMVNRIWMHHFGRGLVSTPSDFGTRAPLPSHPELLDWLASRFVKSGWSVKAMHRLIVSSAVYQQEGVAGEGNGDSGDEDIPRGRDGNSGALVPPKVEEAMDPAWLARYPLRRLDFEQMRDAMLRVSGELDETMGGRPLGLLDPANRRRTVYAEVDRQFLPGVLRTFDFANPDIHVPVRHETTVPQQALFFLNGAFAGERARALAARSASLPGEERVRRLYRWLYQREASDREVALGLGFVAAATSDAPPADPPARKTPWRYGSGEYDEATGRLKGFMPLPHFTGQAWQGAAPWPGGATGWAQLTAQGGHPGDTRAQASVRRWVAPSDGVVRVKGRLKHEPEAGDGVRGFVVLDRVGTLASARVHHGEAEMAVDRIEVRAGEALDFVVDIGDGLNSDQYLWAPVVEYHEGNGAGGGISEAAKDFDGPKPGPRLLEPWAQYAQVLLLANEFAYVD